MLGLGIMGFRFLAIAASVSVIIPEAARTPGLVGGITCLTLASAVLAFAIWAFRKGGDPPQNGSA